MPILTANSDELNERIAVMSDGTAILSFSRGKDSIAAWLKMRRFFPRIIPVFMYGIPGLEFVDRSLRYYEDFFGCHIIRLPHPSLYRKLGYLLQQAPENCDFLEQLRLPQYDYDAIFAMAKWIAGVPQHTYTAVGVRATDSLNRWASIKQFGAANEKRATFFPIYDYKKDDLIDAITTARIKLPIDYKWFGRTFDGTDWRFLAPMSRYAPRDYARVLEWFPLAELELKRIEYREAYYD